MIKGKIKDFFYIGGGNTELTEEFIYNNKPSCKKNEVVVLSGAIIEESQLKKIDINAKISVNALKEKKLNIYKGKGIKIVRKGLAGHLSYYNFDNIVINDDAYFLQVKPEYKDKINIRYLEFILKKNIMECITSNEKGNRTFSKTLFKECNIELPEIIRQNIFVNEYTKLEDIYKGLAKKIQEITEILKKIPCSSHGEYKEIQEVFELISEDRRLTEEFIYYNQGEYPVYSAQKKGVYGYINSYSYDGELINIVQYGDSGKVFYRKGKLNIGRNTCGLVPNIKYKMKLNMKYMKYVLEQVFILNSKGNGLKSLSQETIRKTTFYLPSIEEQNKIAEEYEQLENIKTNIEIIMLKISEILH